MSTIKGVDKDGALRNAGLHRDRLKTESVTTDEVLFAVKEGRAFQAYTQEIVLTGAAKLIVLYLENNDVSPILVTSATVGSGTSAGGADNGLLVEQVGNVTTADDIVQNGTDLIATNRKSGDPRAFDGVVKVGPEAVTGNEFPANGILAELTTARTFNLSAEIPVGGMTALSIRPPAANTTMTVTVTISFHVIDEG